jgi:transposase
MPLTVRPLTTREERYLRVLATKPTTPTRLLQRAAVVWYASQGLRVAAIARAVGVSECTVRVWLQHFNDQGLAGLEDRLRTGRTPQYRADDIATICTVARTLPRALGLSYSRWTLDRLVSYLETCRGIRIRRSRLANVLHEQGVCWFGEDDAPARATVRTPENVPSVPRARAATERRYAGYRASAPRAGRRRYGRTAQPASAAD